ncbi:MAG: LysE family transporter [Thermodesulfobacteriota bacterium]
MKAGTDAGETSGSRVEGDGELLTFSKGFLAGFVLCMPLGPIGLLSIRRTLVQGRLAGVASILGASTVDGLYCSIAGLGVACLTDFLREEQRLFAFLGGLVLVALGLRLYNSKASMKPVNPGSRGLGHAYMASLLLMLSNPMPILVFTAVFASWGAYEWNQDDPSMLIIVAGVFTGSAMWGPILATMAGFFNHGTGSGQMLMLNRIAGLIAFFFGVGAGLLALIC